MCVHAVCMCGQLYRVCVSVSGMCKFVQVSASLHVCRRLIFMYVHTLFIKPSKINDIRWRCMYRTKIFVYLVYRVWQALPVVCRAVRQRQGCVAALAAMADLLQAAAQHRSDRGKIVYLLVNLNILRYASVSYI